MESAAIIGSCLKTTLHLQKSVEARRTDWRRKLVVLGWSYRLAFPLGGALNRLDSHDIKEMISKIKK